MQATSKRAVWNRATKEPLPKEWLGLLRFLDKAFDEARKDFRRESGQ